MDVILAKLPNAGAQIATAVFSTPWRPSPEAGLPERRVRVQGIRQSVSRLAAYNRVCGFGLRDVVPSTWIHVLSFPLQTWLMAQRDFPFPLVGLVHVTNTIEQLRPVLVTERLDLAVQAANLAPHRKGVTFDLVGEASVGDEVVWRGVSNYLARGASLGEAAATDETSRPPAAAPQPSSATAPDLAAPQADSIPEAPARSAGLEGSDQLPLTGQWRLPGDLGRRYAGVSGDVNPIHLSALTARPLGFKRPIIHGMWTYARVLAALDGRLPDAYRVEGRFLRPILLPTKVGFGEARDADQFRAVVMNREQKPYLTISVTPLALPDS